MGNVLEFRRRPAIGVRLSPRLADIFNECCADMTLDRLCALFYSGKSRHAAANCIKVQVHQINSLLRETDWAICSNGKRPPTYRVMKVGNDDECGLKRAA